MLTTFVLAALTAISPGGGSSKTAPNNTICPVLGHAVTPGKSPVVTVRGRAYYICCTGCDTKLAKNPDLYLGKDGMPRNAKAQPPVDPGMHRH